MRRFITRVLGSLVLSFFLASGLLSDASAQTHSSIHGDWRITIDESPSPEFVAQALDDLRQYFEPREPTPDFNWCCFGVGNYGGIEEPIDDGDDESLFFRLADDLDEEGPFVLAGSPECDETSCAFFWSFSGQFSSHQQVAEVVIRLLDNIPNYQPLVVTLQSDPYPVFVGQINVQQLPPQVWSATISAVPEPCAAKICIMAMVAASHGWRRRKR